MGGAFIDSGGVRRWLDGAMESYFSRLERALKFILSTLMLILYKVHVPFITFDAAWLRNFNVVLVFPAVFVIGF
jgi:hypothetical protein